MFLLTEEFMRRYKDRWIIGAYDCINEPISMTPRREELTPKPVYFYEEMIRRCRKIDQKHLFLLNGTQFSSLTYFFDHEFDPEYHNWGISLHAYEMVVPEVASLASVLRTCREQKICLWMGETGGRNEHAWQTTMYEILAEYHAGYNLWCWKTVEGAGEYASYTIREKETYTVSVTYCADKEVKVQAAIQGETLFEGVMPPADEKVTSDVHPYFAYETAPNTLELFKLGTVTGEGILKIEVLDGCARFGQIVIRKSEK